jgi:sugar phosphate isomerase/epimerase
MKRRKFSLLTGAALVGLAASPSFTFKSITTEIRLGGPIFDKYNGPEEWVALLKAEGYRAAYCPVGTDAGSAEIASYKNAAAKAGIVIAEVGAWSNPISPVEATAKEAFAKCVASLQLAEQIGASCCVNIAGSKNPTVWAGPHEDNFSKDTFDQIVSVTRKIIDEVKPTRTFFTLEAMPWIFPESPESYLKLIKAIDRKAFGVHLDPVNMIVSPAVYYQNASLIKEAFQKLGPYIKSCHAKDLVLKENTYLPQFEEVRPGLGKLNYRVFLAELQKFPELPLMMEHLNTAEEYRQAAHYIRSFTG